MTQITVYDEAADRLEELADDCDTSVAEIVDSLLEYAAEVLKDYGR